MTKDEWVRRFAVAQFNSICDKIDGMLERPTSRGGVSLSEDEFSLLTPDEWLYPSEPDL